MQDEKILVALSGGVDSSVACALLKDQRYDVAGAFIRTWSAPWIPCTWRSERLDAMRVAAHLGIPFYTVDLSREYESDVVEYLVREYGAGRTPNPDVMCNAHIKFGAFLTWARSHGFEKIATGHYAQIRAEANDTYSPLYQLFAGADPLKDQSYFLHTLTQDQLGATLFPVGKYHKREVRELAVRYGLPTANKKDSQGVCFLGQVDMADFLAHHLEVSPGPLLDTSGRVIGVHDGALLYTLGQRHGFRVRHESANEPPLFVVAKDVATNTLTVAPRFERTTLVREVSLEQVNLIGVTESEILGRANLLARFRYRQSLVPISLTRGDVDMLTVRFEDPQSYVPPGQSLVLYESDQCLGGGVIASTSPQERV